MANTIDLTAHRTAMSRLTTYVATARLIDRLFWKDFKGGQILVADSKADPAYEPAVLIMVGTVTRGSCSLKPLGNYNPDYENMAKAKLSFSIEAPADPGFERDYLAGVQLLRRLQESGAQGRNRKHLLATEAPNTTIRLGHSLFRKKEDDDDCELLPEDEIEDQPGAAAYYPSAANWPVSSSYRSEFMAVAEAMVFEPLHVFDFNDVRVDPATLDTSLPGALVEVHFTLRHWALTKQNTDSFNADVSQIIILQPRSNEASPSRKASRGIQRPKPSIPNSPIEIAMHRMGKRARVGEAESPTKRPKIGEVMDKGEGTSQSGHASHEGDKGKTVSKAV